MDSEVGNGDLPHEAIKCRPALSGYVKKYRVLNCAACLELSRVINVDYF